LLSLCCFPASLFSLQSHDPHRPLHSFPTRRSSDLADIPHCRRETRIAPEGGRLVQGEEAVAPEQRLVMGNHRFAQHRVKNPRGRDRKSTRLNSSHVSISYAVFCLKKKKKKKKNIKT